MQRTKLTLILTSALIVSCSTFAVAEDKQHDMAHEHGGQVFHKFVLETDYGSNKDNNLLSWDLDGWIGTDENKLWLKSEGGKVENELEDAEFWALYSRNIGTFWDAQIGIRHDTKPDSTSYTILGFNGLAPYWLETEAHLFVSDEGDFSARLHQDTELLITQKVILEPYYEVNAFAQDVPHKDIGAGISDGTIGLQARYEFTRMIAPYVDIHYDRKFGETSSIAESHGEDNDDTIGAIGLRLMF